MSLGFHVGRNGKGTLVDGLREAVENVPGKYGVDIKSAQIFVVNPRNAKDLFTEDEAASVKRYTSDHGTRLVVHGCYIAHPFGDKSANALHIIQRELEWSNRIGAEYFVIHLPRRPADRIAEVYPRLLEMRGNVKICLEIESMRPSADTYETPEKLETLYRKLMPIDPEVALAPDSAHLWSAGVDGSTYENVRRWTDAVDRIGVRNMLMHLNDSAKAFGCGLDNHASLTRGNIWRDYGIDGTRDIQRSGLQAFLEWNTLHDMPVILERDEAGLENDFGVLNRMGFFRKI